METKNEYTRFAVKDCKEQLTKAFEKAKAKNEFVKVRTNGSCGTNCSINGIDEMEGIVYNIYGEAFYIANNISDGSKCSISIPSRYKYSWEVYFDNPHAYIEIETRWLEEEKPDIEKRIEALEKNYTNLYELYEKSYKAITEQPKEVEDSIKKTKAETSLEITAHCPCCGLFMDFTDQLKECLNEGGLTAQNIREEVRCKDCLELFIITDITY